MARKQSLANKRRSQKRRDKKRARTIRSMRQVNGGVKIMDTLRRFGKSDTSRSLLAEPLLEKPLDELAHVVENGPPGQILQPLLARPPVTFPHVPSQPQSSDIVKNIILEQKYNNKDFDKYLKKILSLYSLYVIGDHNLKKYITDKKNTEKVVTPFKEIINKKIIDNIDLISSEDVNILNYDISKSYDIFIQTLKDNTELFLNINLLWLEFILLFKMKMTEKNYFYPEKDEVTFLSFFATYTLLEIFSSDPLIRSEEANIHTYLTFINNEMKKEKANLSAGGSKGKMRRPKSRTRKL